MPTELGLLPTRVSLDVDEALDSFLERLTQANDLDPQHMVRVLRRGEGERATTLAFFMTAPTDTVLGRIERLSGIPGERLRNATLMRYDAGRPLYLAALDPLDRHSYRRVVVQGWFPPFGTQLCPLCVAQQGIWRVHWRLPIVAACIHHGTYLTTECGDCSQRFRSHRYWPLRPVLGPEQPCGNPVALRRPCLRSVLTNAAEPASGPALDCTESVHRAMNGQTVSMFGTPADPRAFLAELRNLATLLLHLGARTSAQTAVSWASDLRDEARARSTRVRGARWGFSPPHSAMVRGAVLGCAHEILMQRNLESGGARLREWIHFVDGEKGGPAVWLINRTKRTPTMERLIAAAVSDRRDVGRRIDRGRRCRQIEPSAIPQMIDIGIYRQMFTGMLGGYERTGRLYVSLCMVRAVVSVENWADAAVRIGLPPDVGSRTSRAARARMRATPEDLQRAIDLVLNTIPASRDFRALEAQVLALARDPANWYPAWRLSTTPARRPDLLVYAVTWMWCEVAQGCLDNSPAWAVPPCHRIKAGYRAFRDRLPSAAQDSLRRLVLPGPAC
ncbi:TniQ family protein [Mycolicibacterium novocastrense]|uniref:TniQ family protein n=1 Tax=Mycolicibacterium novocastrense TaxID=59813 RepID=UPI0010554977|nr:TniQ family protein [Mycolicibacterium novocastrense]